jgi:hypothetical protein
MSPISIVMLLIAFVAIIDAARRPAVAWVEADRKRSFWIVMMALFNVLFVVPYVLFVVPRFPRGGSTTDDTFLKQP